MAKKKKAAKSEETIPGEGGEPLPMSAEETVGADDAAENEPETENVNTNADENVDAHDVESTEVEPAEDDTTEIDNAGQPGIIEATEAAEAETDIPAEDGAATDRMTEADADSADDEPDPDGDAPEEDDADADGEGDEEEGGDDTTLPLTAVVEAVLFAAREPLKPAQLARAVGKRTRQEAVKDAIGELNVHYLETGRAFEIAEISGRYQLMSRPEFAPHIMKIYPKRELTGEKEKTQRLTPAALDTLAIIAYKQPVTRAEIEHVRGVGCGPVLKALMERDSIRIAGKRLDMLGQPLVYGTTESFLAEFGLGSLDELPMRNDFLAILGEDIPPVEVVETPDGEGSATGEGENVTEEVAAAENGDGEDSEEVDIATDDGDAEEDFEDSDVDEEDAEEDDPEDDDSDADDDFEDDDVDEEDAEEDDPEDDDSNEDDDFEDDDVDEEDDEEDDLEDDDSDDDEDWSEEDDEAATDDNKE